MISYSNPTKFKQILNVEDLKKERTDFFIERFENKKVLHVGCVGSNFYRDDKNKILHVQLINAGIDIDGYDINEEGINDMKKEYKNYNFYSTMDEIKNNVYDVVLIPEVLEHVDNIRIFLDEIFSINSSFYFITVPNCEGYHENFKRVDNISIELVHPDHYYWFSAYTLFNSVKKYITDMNSSSMFYFKDRKTVAIEINKK